MLLRLFNQGTKVVQNNSARSHARPIVVIKTRQVTKERSVMVKGFFMPLVYNFKLQKMPFGSCSYINFYNAMIKKKKSFFRKFPKQTKGTCDLRYSEKSPQEKSPWEIVSR